MTSLLLLLLSANAGACEPLTAEAFVAKAVAFRTQLDTAYTRGRALSPLSASTVSTLRQDASCVNTELTRGQIAEVYYALAVASMYAKKDKDTRTWLASLHRVAPDYVMVGPGGGDPLGVMRTRQKEAKGIEVRFGPAVGERMSVDGQPEGATVLTIPYLAQTMSWGSTVCAQPTRRVMGTQLVEPGAALSLEPSDVPGVDSDAWQCFGNRLAEDPSTLESVSQELTLRLDGDRTEVVPPAVWARFADAIAQQSDDPDMKVAAGHVAASLRDELPPEDEDTPAYEQLECELAPDTEYRVDGRLLEASDGKAVLDPRGPHFVQIRTDDGWTHARTDHFKPQPEGWACTFVIREPGAARNPAQLNLYAGAVMQFASGNALTVDGIEEKREKFFGGGELGLSVQAGRFYARTTASVRGSTSLIGYSIGEGTDTENRSQNYLAGFDVSVGALVGREKRWHIGASAGMLIPGRVPLLMQTGLFVRPDLLIELRAGLHYTTLNRVEGTGILAIAYTPRLTRAVSALGD